MSSFKAEVEILRDKYLNIMCNSREEARNMAADVAIAVQNAFHYKTYPFRIGTALRELGFEVLVKDFSDKNLSGILATNTKDGTKLVASVNKSDSPGHQAFALAHELAHYIFDVRDLDSRQYVANYRTDLEYPEDLTEYRANKFATYLLMPSSEFERVYLLVTSKLTSMTFILTVISEYFGVSRTAVRRRIEEMALT